MMLIYIYMYVYMYVCMYICMYVYIYIRIYIYVFVPKHTLKANVHAPRHSSAVVEPYRHCISPQCATFNSQQVEDDGFASDFADGGTPQNSKALWRLLHRGGQGYKSLDQIFLSPKRLNPK